MNINLCRVLGIAVLTGIFVTSLFAQQDPLVFRKGPKSKIYLAETQGESEVISNGIVATAQQAKAFDAPGTVIETKAKAHNAFVYSNGTGLFMEQNTRIKIDRFAQERFLPTSQNRSNPEAEPSQSQSNIVVNEGSIGICTNQLAPGSTMVYTTPVAVIDIRKGRVSIETTATESIVDLLEGDISVRPLGGNGAGQVLRAGDRAIISASTTGVPPIVRIVPSPSESRQLLDDRTNVACNAKKTVFFDANDLAEQEITPNPTVPAKLPTNITVSPDRLPDST